MKMNLLELTRLWAIATGLLLAAWFFGKLYFGQETSPYIPMLVTAIGGFEIFLFGQDFWARKKSRHG